MFATRLFVPPDFNLPAGYGAVAVLAFPAAPQDDDTRSRYIRICRAFVSQLPDAIAIGRAYPNQPQMVTLWPREDLTQPLSVESPPLAQLDGLCASAVDHYSYVAAAGWLAAVPEKARFAADRRGPFLIAWAPPSARGQPHVALLTDDLSDFDDTRTLQPAFALWAKEIEADPSLWSRGWDLTRVKLKLSAAADRYGAMIIAAIKLIPQVF